MAEKGKGERWPGALGRAALVLAFSIVGFLVVPDVLATQLSSVTTAAVRDALVLAWTIAFVGVTSWLLVRVQRD